MYLNYYEIVSYLSIFYGISSQIRLMVGTAVLVVRGVLPPNIVELALEAPLFVPLPIAPPIGLVLVDAGFGYNVNGQVLLRATSHFCCLQYLIYVPSVLQLVRLRPDPRATSDSAMTIHPSRTSDKLPELALLSQEEYETSLRFLQQYIYPRIVQDWSVITNDTEGNAGRKWLQQCEYFRVSDEAYVQFNEVLDTWRTRNSKEDEENSKKDVRLLIIEITRMILINSDDIITSSQTRRIYRELNQLNERQKALQAQDRKAGSRLIHLLPHKRLLPNGLATALVTMINMLNIGKLYNLKLLWRTIR